MEKDLKPKADVLFELSWEVCNKYGGIFTVIKSKAAQMVSYYNNDNYFLIGPYIPKKAKGQFEELAPPEPFKTIFANLEKEGIKCHFGKWIIEGEPNTILVDFDDFRSQTNEIKKQLWDDFKVDSLKVDDFFDEPVTWSWACGKLIEQFAKTQKNKKIVCHFHEWLCGAGLLLLKKNKTKVGLVFTTHATTLGRTIASYDLPLYDMLKKVKPNEEAYKYDVQAKHLIEKETTLKADVFTTVSEITQLEAEALLGRKADPLVYNGLDLNKFPTFEEIAVMHKIQRDRMREFCLYYFSPYYDIDIKNTLFYSLWGRYEYRNKGIDHYIKALSILNQKLKKEEDAKTIVGFIFVPAEVKGIKQELLESRAIYWDIKEYYDEISEDVKDDILSSLVLGKNISRDEIFSKPFLREIKRKTMKIKREGLPPLSTHDFSDPADQTLMALKENGLENKADDKVKIVFYPTYLTGDDRLLGLNYYESIQASHLGIFPSFYEPWGYTPLETAAMGVSAVTTDLAGFGRFLKGDTKDMKLPGIFIEERLGKKDDQAIGSLADYFYSFAKYTLQERVENKLQARELATRADWKILIKNYIEAQNRAVGK